MDSVALFMLINHCYCESDALEKGVPSFGKKSKKKAVKKTIKKKNG